MYLKTIEIVIAGDTLLMHRIGELTMESMMSKGRKTTDIPTPEDEAEDGAYRSKSGELYIPARAVKACLVRASSFYKMGKKSMRPFIAGCVIIQPEEILLGTKKYEIDARPVVIGRGNKIIRHRPLIRNWKVTFNMIYNEDIFRTKDHLDVLRKVLEEAGVRCGLLDNRPERGGENGMFKVISWKEKKK